MDMALHIYAYCLKLNFVKVLQKNACFDCTFINFYIWSSIINFIFKKIF